ncbi:MAG: hypothetical protein EPO08_13185 [Rhodospirillaceae bacterium]|nr:MAG: hypothetical protein EPO08_13185 [Rhodospirillaceae bacterium]
MLDDLSGGLAPERDMVLTEKPADPEMREGTSVWLFEENGAFAFPRLGIEAVSASWDTHSFNANFTFADGRVLDGANHGPAKSPIGEDGGPSVLGAGPITFTCIEPFRRWKMVFDGPAKDGNVSQQMTIGNLDSCGTTQIRLEADMTMVTPAWVQDTSDTTGMSPQEMADALAMGVGCRFEHLFRANGKVTIDGKSREFKGTGLRIHRHSIRRTEGFTGHVWQSAVFPDGRAFGLCVYPTRADGSPGYNQAYIYQGGRMIKARMVKGAFITRVVPSGEDVSFELESELGRTRIKGTTTFSTFMMNNPLFPLTLQQGGALYTWDGQSGYGMIERSTPEKIPVG